MYAFPHATRKIRVYSQVLLYRAEKRGEIIEAHWLLGQIYRIAATHANTIVQFGT